MGCRLCGQLLAEQRGERLRQLAPDHAIVIQQQLLEERLVELPPELGAGKLVSQLAVQDELECLLQDVLDVHEGLLSRLETLLGGFQFPGDPILLFLQQVEGNSSGVVRLEQLLPLVGELHDPGGLVPLLQFGMGTSTAQAHLDVLPQVLGPLGAEPQAGVVLLDLGFDQLNRHGLLGAVGALLVAADADEVGIDGAMPVLGVGDDEPAVALAAEDRALEVVVVLALLLTGGALGLQHSLYVVPGVDVDQRFVVADVGRAPVGDEALVVRAVQDAVELREAERLAGLLRTGYGDEALGGEFVKQAADAPLAGGVLVESPADERASHRIDLDRAQLDMVLDLADVEVADRRQADGAAALGLLGAALDDLQRQVPGVELIDRTHDASEQRTARGVVADLLLADADELHAGRSKQLLQVDIVLAVACPAVELVGDDIRHRLLSDVGEQLLEGRTVGGLGALALLDELGHHSGPERLRLARALLALGRDGVALLQAALLGLPLGADPEVQHGGGFGRRQGGDRVERPVRQHGLEKMGEFSLQSSPVGLRVEARKAERLRTAWR